MPRFQIPPLSSELRIVHASAQIKWSPADLALDIDDSPFCSVCLTLTRISGQKSTTDLQMLRPNDVDVIQYRLLTLDGFKVGLDLNKVPKLPAPEKIIRALFNKLVLGCKGNGIVIKNAEGKEDVVPYPDDRREQFVDAFDYQWQKLIIDALMSAETGSLMCGRNL